MTALRRLWSLKRDQHGMVAPMVAMLGTVLVGSAGLALDVGLYYVGNRDLRAATEAAALAAAVALSSDPTSTQVASQVRAEGRAREYLVKNGYSASVLQSIDFGRYCADGRSGKTAADRFDLNSTTARRCPGSITNAVRLHTAKSSRQYLSRALGSVSLIPQLDAVASATRIDEAGLGITTGILTVQGGLVEAVNDLLGALLGVHLNLSGTQIESLMNNSIDAGRFFDALADEADMTTGTYTELFDPTKHQISLGQILRASATAADADNRPATAAVFRSLATSAADNYPVNLNGLFGMGVWTNAPVGNATSQQSLRAGLNAYQLLTFAVQGGRGAIDLSDAVSRVVAGSTVRLAGVATGPIDRPRFAFGPAGETSVGTSALRLNLVVGLGLGDLPVFIDVAAGTAEIRSITCGEEAATDTTVTVSANSGLVNAYIGQVTKPNAMVSPMPSLSASDFAPASLSVLGLAAVEIRGVAQPVFGQNADVVFGPGGQGTVGRPPSAGTAASIGNGSQVGPLLTSLTNNLTLNVTLLGLCLPIVCSATRATVVNQVLNAVTPPVAGLAGTVVDPLLDNLLAALGLQLGHATLWVTGARCGVPVLI
jgi:uncharacterized membrane protein